MRWIGILCLAMFGGWVGIKPTKITLKKSVDHFRPIEDLFYLQGPLLLRLKQNSEHDFQRASKIKP